MRPEPTDSDVVAPVFKAEWGRLVANLIRWSGDWDLAEEAAQEAFVAAAETWPRTGVPAAPLAWLVTVARNRARDRLRRRATEASRLALLGSDASLTEEGPSVEEEPVPDDRLRLIFTCCHPALAMSARIALTLRTLCGLTSAEIARAFLVTEPTMTKRLVRARAKLKAAGLPYREPSGEQLPDGLAGVLAVIYLLFNEGYAASHGASLTRVDLTAEAIRLASQLHDLLPDQAEVTSLLALMLLTEARRPARVDRGRLVPLPEQDRTLWDKDMVEEGQALLLGMDGPLGPYGLQAAIALEHSRAASASETNWADIAALYTKMSPTPVVRLNHAVAVSMLEGPEAALGLLAELEGPLSNYHLFWATMADLATRLGRYGEAREHLRRALEIAPTSPERRLLAERMETLRGDG